MYSGIDLSYSRICFDSRPENIPRKEMGSWTPHRHHCRGCSLPENGGEPCQYDCSNSDIGSLAYPQSSRRYSSPTTMAGLYVMPVDSHLANPQPEDMLYDDRHHNVERGEYLRSARSATPTYPALGYHSEFFVQSPVNERWLQPGQDSPPNDVTTPVFSLERPPITETLSPKFSDLYPSTFTFQLGPDSLHEVENPDLSCAKQHRAGAKSDESEWEESDNDRLGAKSFPTRRDTLRMSSKPVAQEPLRTASSKNSKMHQCGICLKWFPRPSGLATHMNSHTGLRPYKCPLESCGKSFAVRSNAKRHLRTHGITPTADSVQKAVVYSVNFHTPLVSIVHDTGDPQAKLRWIPQSITSLSNITWSRPTFLDSEDGFPVLPVPLLPSVSPTSSEFAAAGDTPYHPRDWRGLPGPALAL